VGRQGSKFNRHRLKHLGNNEVPNNREPYSPTAVLGLRLNERLSYQEIADIYGKSKSTIHGLLKPFRHLDEGERIEAFQKHKRKVFDGAVLRALTLAFEPGRVKKASSGNFFYGAMQLNQMSRLEADQSTANLAIHQIVEAIEREGQSRPPRELGAGEQE